MDCMGLCGFCVGFVWVPRRFCVGSAWFHMGSVQVLCGFYKGSVCVLYKFYTGSAHISHRFHVDSACEYKESFPFHVVLGRLPFIMNEPSTNSAGRGQ